MPSPSRPPKEVACLDLRLEVRRGGRGRVGGRRRAAEGSEGGGGGVPGMEEGSSEREAQWRHLAFVKAEKEARDGDCEGP